MTSVPANALRQPIPTNNSGLLRQPAYLRVLFPDAEHNNVLVFREGEALEAARLDHGGGMVAFALKVDVLALHLMVEWADPAMNGVEQFTYWYGDLHDELVLLVKDAIVRNQPGAQITRADALGVLLEKIQDGPDDSKEGMTLCEDDLGDPLVEAAA